MYDTAKQINNLYDNQFAASQAQMKAARDKAIDAYNKQNADAKPKYQQMRNTAYTDQSLLERARKENMANMGMSGAGGTSQTFQQRNTNNLMNILGDTNLQQRDFSDNINLAIRNLGTQYDADTASLRSEINAARTKDLLAQSNLDYDRTYQKEQDKLARETLEYERAYREQGDKFERAYSLYMNKGITASQFETMTGISVNSLPKARSGGSGSGRYSTEELMRMFGLGESSETSTATSTATSRGTAPETRNLSFSNPFNYY